MHQQEIDDDEQGVAAAVSCGDGIKGDKQVKEGGIPTVATVPYSTRAIGKTQEDDKLKKDLGLGDVELQLLGEGEEQQECGSAWEQCSKYPGHEGFIPLSEFSLQHLPERHRSEKFFEFIKSRAYLTVRLRVRFSANRPKAKGIGFTGTGYICAVDILNKGCFCKVCKAHGHKDKKWWRITLRSATHCVFDEDEAKNAKVDLFYDTAESLKSGKVTTLYGVRIAGALKTEDNCILECGTHDDKLGGALKEGAHRFTTRLNKLILESKLGKSTTSSQNKFMVCVSHPHGAPKHVTVGELRHRHDVTNETPDEDIAMSMLRAANGRQKQSLEYTNKTCPGSSGAGLLCLDFSKSDNFMVSIISSECTHLRANPSNGLNVGYGERYVKGFPSEETMTKWFSGRHTSDREDKKQQIEPLDAAVGRPNEWEYPKYYDIYK